MKAGEVSLARFPFGDMPGMKLRPVLLLTGPIGAIPEVVVAYISSVVPAQRLPSDIVLDQTMPEFQLTGLKVTSTLRLHKVATIHCSSVIRSLGKLDASTAALALERLRQVLLVTD